MGRVGALLVGWMAAAHAQEPAQSIEAEPALEDAEDLSPPVVGPLQPVATGFDGSLGWVRVAVARPGRKGELRFSLAASYLQASGFPVPGLPASQGMARLGASYSAFDAVEIYATLRSLATSTPAVVPPLVQAQGDFRLGVRAGWSLPWMTSAGFDLQLFVPAGTGGILPALFAPAVTARALGGWDLRSALPRLPFPIELVANLGLTLDNTGALAPGREEPAADFAMALTRYPRLTPALAAVTTIGGWQPFLEIAADVPLGVPATALALATAPVSSSLEVAAWRLVPGVRFYGPAGLSFTAAVEVGLGKLTAIPGFASAPPWNLVFGVGWGTEPSHVDAPAPPPIVLPLEPPPAPPPPPPPPPTRGRLAGHVRGADGQPIPGAVVSFGDAAPPVATDAAGVFISHEIEAGLVPVEIHAEGFAAALADGKVEAGRDAELVLSLSPAVKPPQPPVLALALSDPGGAPIEGLVTLALAVAGAGGAGGAGPSGVAKEIPVGREGNVVKDGLSPGSYLATATAPGRLAARRPVELREGAPQAVAFVLSPRAEPPLARLDAAASRVWLARPVRFAAASDALAPDAAAVLDEVADLVLTHPEIARLRIEAHVDRAGKPEAALGLTERQAQVVARYLAGRGVPPAELEPVGKGFAQPAVPGLGPRAREQNRRVEFAIVSPAPAAP